VIHKMGGDIDVSADLTGLLLLVLEFPIICEVAQAIKLAVTSGSAWITIDGL
jgi:hypothetical protein